MTTTLSDGTSTVVPILITGWATSRPARTVVHDIIDRSSPEVTLREAGLRTGVFEVVFATAADAFEAEAMHTQATAFTFADDTAGTFDYVVPEGTEIEVELDETRRAWIVRVPFQEVPGA